MSRDPEPLLLEEIRKKKGDRNLRGPELRAILLRMVPKDEEERQNIANAVAWIDPRYPLPKRPVITAHTDAGTAIAMRRHTVTRHRPARVADSNADLMAMIENKINSRLSDIEERIAKLETKKRE